MGHYRLCPIFSPFLFAITNSDKINFLEHPSLCSHLSNSVEKISRHKTAESKERQFFYLIESNDSPENCTNSHTHP